MSVYAKNFCFTSAKILVNAYSHCDLQEALRISTWRVAARDVGVVLDE